MLENERQLLHLAIQVALPGIVRLSTRESIMTTCCPVHEAGPVRDGHLAIGGSCDAAQDKHFTRLEQECHKELCVIEKLSTALRDRDQWHWWHWWRGESSETRGMVSLDSRTFRIGNGKSIVKFSRAESAVARD